MHEGKVVDVDAAFGEHGRRGRTLKRQEHAVERLDRNVEPGAGLVKLRRVGFGVAGIGHDHEPVVAEARHDQVVDDPGRIVQKERVFRLRDGEIARHQRTGARQRLGRLRAADLDQLHVRDVEQPGLFAGVKMFLHHPGRVGDRHRPSGKAAEARAGIAVKLFKGEVFQIARITHMISRVARHRPLGGRFAPLCRKPERLAQPELCRRRLHLRRRAFAPTFQSVLACQRFLCLRDFGRFPLRRPLGGSLPQTGRAFALDESEPSLTRMGCHLCRFAFSRPADGRGIASICR